MKRTGDHVAESRGSPAGVGPIVTRTLRSTAPGTPIWCMRPTPIAGRHRASRETRA